MRRRVETLPSGRLLPPLEIETHNINSIHARGNAPFHRLRPADQRFSSLPSIPNHHRFHQPPTASSNQVVSLPPIRSNANASHVVSQTLDLNLSDTPLPLNLNDETLSPMPESMHEDNPWLDDDTLEMQQEGLPLPVLSHVFEDVLWLRLYDKSPKGECFGYALLRILVESLPQSREALRRNLEYHALHFNALNPLNFFPATIEAAMKLVLGQYDDRPHHVYYEVCPNKCDFMFPVMHPAGKAMHCHPDHIPCGLCACPTCGGRRFIVWNNNHKGIVRPNAGGVYLGLFEAFESIMKAPGFSDKRTAFLDFLARTNANPEANPRTSRFHTSPEYYRLCDDFGTSDSNPNRANFMFYTLFWDGLSVMRLTKDYSINVLLIHFEDMFMRDQGFGAYAVPVLMTNGPNKTGLTDAHMQLLFADIKKAAYEGSGDTRFVLSGIQADRPACEDLLGLRGHTNKTGCGFCWGGTGFIGGYTRYYGYSEDTTQALIKKYEPKNPPKKIISVDMTSFKEEAAKAAAGDRCALVHRKPAILEAAPWLNVMVSATFPVAHILANAVGKKFLQQFSGTSKKPATCKLPKVLRKSLVSLMSSLQLPHDAGRGSEVFGPHRATMTITDVIASVTMFLPLVFSVAFEHAGLSLDEENTFMFLKYEGELLSLATRWYYYGWSLPEDENGNPLSTFESKSWFAHRNALLYAKMVEATGYLPALTYGLHAFVTHFTEQEMERGGIACTNELWGERGLKKVATSAKGRTSSSNVEMTIANQMNLQRSLMTLEQALKDRDLLIDGKSLLGLDEAVFSATRCVIVVQNLLHTPTALPAFLLTYLDTSQVNILCTPLYASARLSTGEVIHGERYTRLYSRTSHFVMFVHHGVATYGSVCCFYESAGCDAAVRAVIEVLPVEGHRARGTVVELRSGRRACVIVPASTIICKLVVLHDLRDNTLLYATESLHVRVSEEE
jgi:hypothetical protein